MSENDILTPEQCAEIAARAEKATKGPWVYDGMHFEIQTPYRPDGYWLIVSECRGAPHEEYQCDQFGHQFNPDYDFIAHARTDVPNLLRTIAALRAELFLKSNAGWPETVQQWPS